MKRTAAKKKPFFTYFSGDSQETLDSWTGGGSYKGLFHIELFGIKIEVWKRL